MKRILFSLVLILGLSAVQFAQTNQYLHFDGVDDLAQLDGAGEYLVDAPGVTMAGWFYTDELVYGQGMMSIRGGGTGGEGEFYLIQLSNGVLECRFIGTGGFHEVVGPAGTIQAGVWQHVCLTYDGSELTLYVDGSEVGSTSASGTFEENDRPFTIGKCLLAGFNFIYGGRADEVSLWSRGLSQSEVQDMMMGELEGTEDGLEAYYKFNQGAPGGDNTSITQLNDEVGPGSSRNADLLNFALTGEESNFGGILEDGFQSIEFPAPGDRLISDVPFDLNAVASSGLPVSYEVLSGPASIDGSTVTLDGVPGTVVVRASQAGSLDYDAAADVETTFLVHDPAEVVPNILPRHPLAGDVVVPANGPIRISMQVSMDYQPLFEYTNVSVEVSGTVVQLEEYSNGHFIGWWQPPAEGDYTVNMSASNNYGYIATDSYSIEVTSNGTDQDLLAFEELWVSVDVPMVEATVDLPSHQGAYSSITGTLFITCPPGGCDPWDRVSHVEVKGKDGEWYEIIRYLTPYGVACDHQIDLTDFASLLSGRTDFRVILGTFANGFEYTLQLEYEEGEPDFAYSEVEKLWYQTYPFGDLADLQPCEDISVNNPENLEAAKIKLVSTGHGWGTNNTGNAAEFHEDYHHIWVDGAETFEQWNWNTCSPNPDGCQPQAGTWQFDRAGWCPGSIAQFFDYDMTPYAGQDEVDLQYIFDEDYTDFCHPNNPNCITGVTCENCDDGFNPHLIVTSYYISMADQPVGDVVVSGLDEVGVSSLGIYPNPSSGIFFIQLDEAIQQGVVEVLDAQGRTVLSRFISGLEQDIQVDIQGLARGVYQVSLRYDDKRSTGTFILE